MFFLLSPFIYKIFNNICRSVIKPFLYDSKLQGVKNWDYHVKTVRETHNLSLSVFSFTMSVFSGWEIWSQWDESGSLICQPYTMSSNLSWIIPLFYYSKFWEWLDTLFLIIGDKRVSNLHYFHHASTPYFSYVNTYLSVGVSPGYLIAVFLNTFVHGFMYWYYLYPRGVLRSLKMWITRSQIVQHMIMLAVIISSYIECPDVMRVHWVSFLSASTLYSYFFIQFLHFYFVTYKSKMVTKI